MVDERTFTQWCYKKYVEEKSTHSVVTQSYINQVIRYLQCRSAEEENKVFEHFDSAKRAFFKFRVKEKKYSWMTIPLVNKGSETVLTVPKKNKDGYLIVCPVEKFYSTLKGIHEASGHAKKFTMWKKVTDTYAFLPRSIVEQFLRECVICKLRAAKENKLEREYIQAAAVLERVQVLGDAGVNAFIENEYQAMKLPVKPAKKEQKKPKASPKGKKKVPVVKQAAQKKKKKRKVVVIETSDEEDDMDYDDSMSEDEMQSEGFFKIPSERLESSLPVDHQHILTVDLSSTHPSVRIKGTENNYNTAQCFDTNCPETTPHMHCPFCVKTDCYTDPVILKAHYRVKHVDKGIDFAGLKILRCCDRCDIVGVIKGEKKFKGAHWHCYKCKNGFNRRDEAIKHYKTHFRNPQTTFQIQIAQEVNQSVAQGFETDEASVSIQSEEFSVQSIHPVLTEAVTCMASADDQTFTQTSNFPVIAKMDGNVSMPGIGAIETVDVSDTQTIMIIQDDPLQDSCVTQDITGDEHFTKTSMLEDSPKQDHDQTIQNLVDTIHKLQEANVEKNKEIEILKKKVQDKDLEISHLKGREQELLDQLKLPDDKKLKELREQLEAQHKDLIEQQLAQLRKTYFQTHSLQPKILIVNNSLNTQLEQQIGLDTCTINTDGSGTISLDFNNPNTTVNATNENINTTDDRGIGIETNTSGVIGQKCDGKEFEILEQEFTDSLGEERLQIEDGSVRVETDGHEPPVKKMKGKIT